MSEYIVKGAEPNETVLHTRTPNGYEEWRWLPVREEIVRCRDCKHWDDLTMYSDVGVCTKPCGDPNVDEGAWTKPNGFCAWGERRDA